jgi:hypothetical protein
MFAAAGARRCHQVGVNAPAVSSTARFLATTRSFTLRIACTTDIFIGYLNALNIERLAARDVQLRAAAGWTRAWQWRAGCPAVVTRPTDNVGRLAAEAQHSAFGRRAAAEQIEIELDRVIDNAAQLTDHQIDCGDTRRVMAACRLQRHG